MFNQYYPQYGQVPQYPQGYQLPNNGAMPDQLAQWRGAGQMQAQQMPQPQTGGWQNTFAWVQGEAGAKSYLVAPGVRAFLMDTEADVFYIKTADASGIPMPLRYFDYTERTNDAYATAAQLTAQPAAHQIDLSGYITREEFDAFRAAISAQASTATTKKNAKVTEVEDNG